MNHDHMAGCWTHQHNVLDLFQAHDDSAALLNLMRRWRRWRSEAHQKRCQSGQEDAFANGSRRLICKMEMEMEILRAGSSRSADSRSGFGRRFSPAISHVDASINGLSVAHQIYECCIKHM